MEHLLLNLLREEVSPAVGCTEPSAVALAVSKAANSIGGKGQRAIVWVSANILKNSMGVTIPNTNEVGLHLAAALGMVLGRPDAGLELFHYVKEVDIKKAHKLISNGSIDIKLADEEGFYIKAIVEGEMGIAQVDVKQNHTNVVKVVVNDEIIFCSDSELEAVYYDITKYSINDIVTEVESMNLDDLQFLQDGLDMNMIVADMGMSIKYGLGVSLGLKKMQEKGLMCEDTINRVRIAVAGACDARMAGINLPIMSIMGSGNLGIAALVPLGIVAKEIGALQEHKLRAVAISHLVTAYIKQHTGKLSPICGCSVAAGAGSASAITWLLGGSKTQISGAIKNIIGNLAGLICDGAKGGCSFKLSTTAVESIIASYLALQNINISEYDGIIDHTTEDTIKNLAKLSNEGMSHTDKTILSIMVNKLNSLSYR